MNGAIVSDRRRPLRWLLLGALVAVSAARLRYAGVHMDLARDMFIAWRTLHGESLPLSGPVLAGSIHLGPFWYWLLCALLALGRGFLGALLLLGALAGLQFPLAYLVGKELHSRRAGMLWALGLLIPCWSAFEWILPLHYLLTTTFVLAFGLCAARYCRRPRLRYLAGMALMFVLCLHAHPANAGLVFIGAAVVTRALRRRECRLRDIAMAGAIGLLPLLPYFIWDALQGFADLRAGAAYLGSGEHTGRLAASLPLLAATAIGGTSYWFAAILGWSSTATTLAVSAIAGIGLLGSAGAVAALRSALTRPAMLAMVASASAILLTTALLRDMTPYYMTTALRIALVGSVALGLAELGCGLGARSAQIATGLVAVLLFGASVTATAHLQKHGEWPFNFFPLFNVTEAPQPTAALPLMPAYGVGASGAFLCAAPAPSAHGVFAQYLLHGYAIDMRLACGRSDVKLGGADAQRQHWLGLSRAALKRVGLRPERRLGSIGLVGAHPRTPGPAIDPPALPVYPAYLPKFSPAERSIRFVLGADRHIAVSNIAFGFAANPDVQLTIGGRTLEPVTQDSVSRVYVCRDCGDDADVAIALKSSDLDDVDVVTF